MLKYNIQRCYQGVVLHINDNDKTKSIYIKKKKKEAAPDAGGRKTPTRNSRNRARNGGEANLSNRKKGVFANYETNYFPLGN